ncbi:2'-5' RNA ligase family protein [Pedobacter soli]|uniref:2'-5' RNA ligase superfamily protein n=1 Tax=Pedobacter soli TaxID=390242 RepID=A0A1G6JV15_9SPHI|nr:2'-5' RNA ligase family protein [Pedobacter soli]SDC22471.1 2'-5' RNA ligase superfamily protein [Pedobacter soli]
MENINKIVPVSRSTCILTARLDTQSQLFFDRMRKCYFPPERNFLNAHLTLFHQLPDSGHTLHVLRCITHDTIKANVKAVKSIGYGIAYFIECQELQLVHQKLQQEFRGLLSAQDQQPLRPHVTIQNKVSPERARSLLLALAPDFEPFEIYITGLDLWHYLEGPWSHYQHYPFSAEKRL